MSNDNYNAPVIPERLENLKGRTESLSSRLAIYWNGTLDSMELSGLAEELDDLAAQYRSVRNRSVEEHQDGLRLRIVTAHPVSDRIHPSDGNVAGRYRYFAKTDEEALDQFHSEVPVKMLEDFNIWAELYVVEMPTNRGDC